NQARISFEETEGTYGSHISVSLPKQEYQGTIPTYCVPIIKTLQIIINSRPLESVTNARLQDEEIELILRTLHTIPQTEALSGLAMLYHIIPINDFSYLAHTLYTWNTDLKTKF